MLYKLTNDHPTQGISLDGKFEFHFLVLGTLPFCIIRGAFTHRTTAHLKHESHSLDLYAKYIIY